MLKPISRQKPDQPLSLKLISLLKSCLSTKQLQQIHTQMLTNAIDKPNFLLSKAIDLKSFFTYSLSLFNHISEPNDYAFNIMIRGLTTTWKKYTLTLQLYYHMKSFGLKPNKFTYPFLFIACSNLLEPSHARCAHSSVFKLGLDRDEHVRHSLITMYSKCLRLDCARKVFDEITDRDLVSWNSMISGYSKMGFSREALGLFREMREVGFEPNDVTLVSVLCACGDLGDLGFGKWVEEFVVETKLEINSFIASSLIGMYGKCGDLSSARRVFDSTRKAERVTWNAMISGYAQNGFSTEAIALFKEMRELGVDPDAITVVVILSSCASIGALETGKWVDRYASERGLKRDIYVSTALLNMYAKCGTLEDAFHVFDEMPEKNEVSYNAMISAFAFHGRANEAISLFRHMVETVRPDEVTFIGLLSACVHSGLVEEGLRLFDSMKSTFCLTPRIEHYSCLVDLLARSGRVNEAWSVVEEMSVKPDAVLLGALLGACQKFRDDDMAERVTRLLLDLEPMNSGNYVILSKVYAKSNKLDESANMRVLMRERGVNKTPGCSWIEFKDQLREFHAGDDFLHNNTSKETCDIYGLLNEDMKREGYIPNIGVVV